MKTYIKIIPEKKKNAWYSLYLKIAMLTIIKPKVFHCSKRNSILKILQLNPESQFRQRKVMIKQKINMPTEK